MSIVIAGMGAKASGADDPGRVFAGTAKVDITYPAGAIRGNAILTAEDIKDRLFARVVVLQDSNVSVAIVSADIIFFTSARVIREAKEKWNVDHVILCGTHTHSGGYPNGGCTKVHPQGTANPAWTRMGDPAEVLNLEFPEDPWYKTVEDKVIVAIGDAMKNCFPANVAAGKEVLQSAYLAHNRRRVKADGKVEMLWTNPERLPTHPLDQTVRVIRIDDDKGKPRALLVNYACHATTLMGSGVISADFPGAMCDFVEAELGDDCMAMFIQGAEGDINSYEMKLRGEHGLNIARQTGISLGKAAVSAAKAIVPRKRPRDSVKVKESVLSLAHKADKTKSSKVGILTLVVNDEIAIVTIPGEPFIQHQLDLARKSPLADTFLFALAYCGTGTPSALYIPTLQAIKEGGYGAGEASFLEAGAGEKMVDEGVASITELMGTAGESGRPKDRGN